MTCLSCHSMHAAEPDDQLLFIDDPATPEWEDDRACTQCHERFAAAAERVAHTRHPASSTGSRCVGCHMPFQTWGLLKPIRAHRISSPDASVSAATRLPNGCNDCHVDRSLAWAARHLADWYGHETPVLPEADRHWAMTVVDLLGGHALSRALAAARLGRAETFEASPTAWRAPLLVYALGDGYPAVRWAGLIALRSLPGFEGLEHDHLAPSPARLADLGALGDRAARAARAAGDPPEAIPLEARGSVAPGVARDLVAGRPRIRIAIRE